MPEQLPLEVTVAAPVPNRFVIPDDPVVTPKGTPVVKAVEEVAKPAEAAAPGQDKVDPAPTAEPEAKPEPELTPEQLAAKRERRAQNKLEKAYRVRAEALAKADLLEKRLAELEAKSAPVAPQPGEPTLEQFGFDPEKYAAAKAEFAKTQATKEYETKQRTEYQKQAHQKLVSDWETKAERGADKYDDWAETVGELQPNSPFAAALMEAENGEDIAHYLGTNPKEAQRISKLPPLSQVREIGKLEAKLSSKPVETKTPSKAPAPVTPIVGTAPVATPEPSDNDDIGVWMKKRSKQVAARR